MATCKICNKSIVRLKRHLKSVHKVANGTTRPTHMKDFIRMCQLWPIHPREWKILHNQSDALQNYLEHDVALPENISQILTQCLTHYLKQQNETLVILSSSPKHL